MCSIRVSDHLLLSIHLFMECIHIRISSNYQILGRFVIKLERIFYLLAGTQMLFSYAEFP